MNSCFGALRGRLYDGNKPERDQEEPGVYYTMASVEMQKQIARICRIWKLSF